MTTSRRHYNSLDGLRGVAALVVVIYHSMIATPRFAEIRLQPGEQVLSPLEHLISSTPLRLLWSGSEAVVVFFVLSGFVLSLPFVRNGDYPGPYFYPRRALRLYLPAIASLVFAFLMALIIPRAVIPGASQWVNEHAELANGPQQVVLGSSLMHGWGGLNLSLWSLRWEVLFSMLLVAFLWFGRVAVRALWVKVSLTIAVAALWPLLNLVYPNGVFIVVFILGVLMAYNIEVMERLAARISTTGWVLLFLAAATLLTYSGIVVGFGGSSLQPLLTLWVGFACLGAVLIVFAAMYWRPLVGLMETAAVQWLGEVSFSLYLIQDPVIVSLAEVTGGLSSPWLVVPIGIMLCLAVAYLFYRVVEHPSHLLSRSFLRGQELRRAAVLSPAG